MTAEATASPSHGAPVAVARGLVHGYGRRSPVIDGAEMTVLRGEVVGVAGPSGTGKSTLLRLLGGGERPRAGHVELGGTTLWSGWRRTPRLPRPGYAMPVFQHPAASLDPRWPLWRTVSEPLLARHRPAVTTEQRRAAVTKTLERVGLGHVDTGVRPSALSLGQCQRVALARALVAEPELLLADEPTSSLDVITAAGVLRLLRALADTGTAIVVVSHDLRLLDVLSDRVLRLDAGELSPVARVEQPGPTGKSGSAGLQASSSFDMRPSVTARWPTRRTEKPQQRPQC